MFLLWAPHAAVDEMVDPLREPESEQREQYKGRQKQEILHVLPP